MEISTTTSFLIMFLGLVVDILCIYFGYKGLKWIYHKFVPVKNEKSSNIFVTTDGKTLYRAPWNGRLYEDLNEYEHDKKRAEALAMDYMNSPQYFMDNGITSKVYGIYNLHLK